MPKSKHGSRHARSAQRRTHHQGHPARRGSTARAVGVGDPNGTEVAVAGGFPDAGPEHPQGVLHTTGPLNGLPDQLGGAGLPPWAVDMVARIVSSWTPLLRRGCDALDAELVGSELLGMLRLLAPADADLAQLATWLIGDAVAMGSREALAMVSVLATLAPGEVRPVAAAAAAQLSAAGIAAPPWAAGVGRPTVGMCFGYADFFGQQETIGLCFGYGRIRHAFSVLIDHMLGGGIKDCFITGHPGELRVKYRSLAQRSGLGCQDYTPADAATILGRALANEPCPELPDQAEDVRRHIDLLRSRLDLLSAKATARPL